MTLLFLVVVLGTQVVSAQEYLGKGSIKIFTRSQYGGGAQNWAIAQDKKNRLYIANNEGLMVFDGTNWQVYPVPNRTILRSICFGPGQKLFAGAQDEIGYFAPDKTGSLYFTSLKSKLPLNDRTFTDVWELEVIGSDVFFRTNQKIFKLSGDVFTVYPAPSNWVSLHKNQGYIFAQDDKAGLMRYENGIWKTFIQKDLLPANFVITDIGPYKKDTSLLSTVSHGLFLAVMDKLIPFKFSNTGFNSLQHITSLSVLQDSTLLIGTYYNGVYHITPKGKVLENVSTKNGLPNNTVRFVFDDKNGNVWAGLDNGLAFFSYNNSILHINPPAFNNGAGYNAIAQGNDLYFALSTGLYGLPIESSPNLNAIVNQPQTILGGLTWNISSINKQLIAGRDDGLWKINKQEATLISSSTGYWTTKPIPGTAPQQFAAGNYIGIEKYIDTDGKFTSLGQVEKFVESSRYIETDSNNIWVSHPYRGVYRISLRNKTVQLFTEKEGFPGGLDNHVFKIKNKIVFATSMGIYEYDEAAKKMIKSKMYEPIFGNLPIRYMKEDGQSNIWFVQEKMTGVVDYNTGIPVIHYIPELKNKILSGFENIFPYDSRNILVGGEAGFYHINYEKYKESIKPFTAYVTQVKTTGANDSKLFGGYMFDSSGNQESIDIPYKLNSLLFSYAASAYNLHNHPEFSYYLQGFDMGWSSWSSNIEKEYTNLPAGSYIFQIKARQSPSHESAVYEFTFTIQPPWYKSIWAYILYFLLAVGSFYGVLNYQAKRHRKKQEAHRLSDLQKFEEEQKQMAYQHQIELAKSDKELIRMQNEKLEWEIGHKNAELASATMNLVQKKEFILKLKAELQKLQKTAKVGDDNPELKKVLKALSEEEKLNEEWEQFSQHFNSVHGDFLTLLKKKFPLLKPHELRLCAYLRMNLSSKEIAPLMSISIRGVEISRYRLRKKMALPTEANLVQYLMDLQMLS